ncbi:hypothetical protein BDAP_000527 [Binucleata daphniae]
MTKSNCKLIYADIKECVNIIVTYYPKLKTRIIFSSNASKDELKIEANQILRSLIELQNVKGYKSEHFKEMIVFLAYQINRLNEINIDIISFFIENCHNDKCSILVDQIDFLKQGTAYLEYCQAQELNNVYFFICFLWILSDASTTILLNKLIKDKKKIKYRKNYVFDYNIGTRKYEPTAQYDMLFLSGLFSSSYTDSLYKKWEYLIKICEHFCVDSFYRDVNFFADPKFKVILSDYIVQQQLCFIYSYKVTDVKTLYTVFPFLLYKDECMRDYINRNNHQSENLKFDIFPIYTNFAYINSHCNFEKINVILRHSNHSNYHNINIYEGLTERQKNARCKYLETIKSCSSNSDDNTLENLVDVDLNKQTTTQNNIYKQSTSFPDSLQRNEIVYYINDEEAMSKILCDTTNMNNFVFIQEALNGHFLIDDFIHYFENYTISENLVTFFLFKIYKYKKITGYTCDSGIIVREYLDKDFISYLFETEQLEIDQFIVEIHKFLHKCDFNNSIEYNDEFYNLNEFFYSNFSGQTCSYKTKKILITLMEILEYEETREWYLNNVKNQIKFTIQVIKEALQIEKDAKSNFELSRDIYDLVTISNPYFAFKVITDLVKLEEYDNFVIKEIYQKYRKSHPDAKIEYIDIILNQHKHLSKIYFDKQKDINIQKKDLFIISATLYLFLQKNKAIKPNRLFEFLQFNNTRTTNLVIEKLECFDAYKTFYFSICKSNIITINHNKKTICKFTSFINFSVIAINNLAKISINNSCIQALVLIAQADIVNITKNDKTEKKIAIENLLKNLAVQSAILLQKDIEDSMRKNNDPNKNLYMKIITLYSIKHKNKNIQKFCFSFFLDILDNIKEYKVMQYIEKLFVKYNYTFLKMQLFDLEYQQSIAYNFPNVFANTCNVNRYISKSFTVPIASLILELEKKNETKYLIKAKNNACQHPYTFTIEFDTYDVRNTKLELFLDSSSILIDSFRKALQINWRFMDVICDYNDRISAIIQTQFRCPVCILMITKEEEIAMCKSCTHCAMQYHSECLRKWFVKTRYKTCPICRKPMCR